MSDSFSLVMSRTRAILVVVCFVAAGAFLFVAGTASGLLMANAGDQGKLLKESAPVVQPIAAPSEKPSSQQPADLSETAPQTAQAGSADPAATNIPTLVALTPETSAASSQPQVSAAAIAAAAQPAGAKVASKPLSAEQNVVSAGATPHPATPASYAVPLAIRVCSFSGKASAETMVNTLASKGYHATLIQSVGALGRTWFVVRLGPYTEWNAASNDAAHIAVAENVRPQIGPMR